MYTRVFILAQSLCSSFSSRGAHQSSLSSASAASSTAMPTVTVSRQEDEEASFVATPHWVRIYCSVSMVIPHGCVKHCYHLNNYRFDVEIYSFHHHHTNTLIGMRLRTMILWDHSYILHASGSSPKKQCIHPQQKTPLLLEFYRPVKEVKTTGTRWKTGRMLR